jgi:hypothetical protein
MQPEKEEIIFTFNLADHLHGKAGPSLIKT